MKKGVKKICTKAKSNETKENSEEYYTEEEMNILDNFNAKINYKFEDDEIYELMQKYKDNEEAILNELNEELKEREKRGDEYEWHDVGKSN